MQNRPKGRTPAPRPHVPSAGRPHGTEPPTDAPDLASSPAVPGPATAVPVLPAEPPEHLFRRLLSAYLAGARVFEVVERPRLSPSTREVVREFCRRTRGPEVVRDHGTLIELVDLDEDRAFELGSRLRGLGEKVLAFHRGAVASWDTLPLGDDGVWARKDDEIDREAWYLERRLALGQGAGTERPWPSTPTWTVVRSLERIADHAVTLGEVGPRLADLERDGGLRRELGQFHRQAMAHLEEVLRSPDGSRANDLLDVGEALIAGGRALSERLLPAVGDGSMSPASAAAVARALEAIVRTVAYAQDIAQAFFDQALRVPARSGAPSVIRARSA